MVQGELWDSILLGIARLTDRSTTKGRDNLTIRNLEKLVPDAKTKVTVKQLVETAIDKSEFCRDWRNRRLAHRDLGLAIDGTASPLKAASRNHVNDALASLVAVLNAVQSQYKEGVTHFGGLYPHGGAIALLRVLDDGVRAQEARAERIRSGTFEAEDIATKDI